MGELAIEAREAGLSDDARAEFLGMMESAMLPLAIAREYVASSVPKDRLGILAAFQTLAARLGAVLDVPPPDLPFPAENLARCESVILALSVALRDGAKDTIRDLDRVAQLSVRYQVFHPRRWVTAKSLLEAILDSPAPSSEADSLYTDLAEIIRVGFPGTFDIRTIPTMASRIKGALSARTSARRYAEMESERRSHEGELERTRDARMREGLEYKITLLRVRRAQRIAIDALVAVGIEKTEASAMFDSDKAGGLRYVEKKFANKKKTVSSR